MLSALTQGVVAFRRPWPLRIQVQIILPQLSPMCNRSFYERRLFNSILEHPLRFPL
jgi:hypothetical protein